MNNNPYETLYNENIRIRQNMSNQQLACLAQQLGLLHNTLGKAISNIIHVLGSTIIKNQKLNQQEPLRYNTKEKSKFQQMNQKNLQTQLQKFQFHKGNNAQKLSHTLSNSQTCSLQNKSVNGNNRNLTQQFQLQTTQKLRLNCKVNSSKSVQQIFKQTQNSKEFTPNLNKSKKGFDIYQDFYKSQNSNCSDIEQSSMKKQPIQNTYKPNMNGYNTLSEKKYKNKSQFGNFEIESCKQQKPNQNKVVNYDDFLKNKEIIKTQRQINQQSNSYNNQPNLKKNNKEYLNFELKSQSQDSQQMIIRQQKLKKYNPNATYRLVGLKKADKQGMKGIQCPNCKQYYNALGLQFKNICECSSRHRSNADAPVINKFKMGNDI